MSFWCSSVDRDVGRWMSDDHCLNLTGCGLCRRLQWRLALLAKGAARCEGSSQGEASGLSRVDRPANLATHSLQMKISVSLAKSLGSLTG